MTVKDLIEELQRFPPDMEVVRDYDGSPLSGTQCDVRYTNDFGYCFKCAPDAQAVLVLGNHGEF